MVQGSHLPAERGRVRESLLAWYEESHRQFPWRDTTDPYHILVAEVMSQQTQLDRIVEPWWAFLDRWPDVEALAEADRADVVALWTEHNLGYNNRARYLHEAAGTVVDEYDGEFPETPEGLESLMGVGPYTANAVASFAFNNGDAVVDTNVKRVLFRAFGVPDEESAFEEAARTLMPEGKSRAWNNAIMELGGVACKTVPECDDAACPWRRFCEAYRTGDFDAPDVPTQTSFEGSRRQKRGRVIEALAEHGPLPLRELGPRVRVDYSHDGPTGEGSHGALTSPGTPPRESAEEATTAEASGSEPTGREWLLGLLEDLEADGLVEILDEGEAVRAGLKR